MQNQEIGKIVESVVKEVLHNKSKDAQGFEPLNMNLALAKRIIHRVEDKAREMGVNAVVAVSNTAARPVAIECMDDSYIASYDVAINKAYTVVALKMSTIELKALSQPGGSLYGIQFTNQNQIVIFGGGVPLIYKGHLIGGLGVSGGTEEQDTALAAYGGSVLAEEIACLA